MLKKKRLILVLVFLGFLLTGFYFVGGEPESVEARTKLKIKFPSDPVFDERHFMPGDCTEKTIKISGKDKEENEIIARSQDEIDPDNLASVLTLTIKKGEETFFEGPLSNFYNDGDGVSLGYLEAKKKNNFTFTICFDQNAGDIYQGKSTQFDLVIGDVYNPPPPPPPRFHHFKRFWDFFRRHFHFR